jgi:hypothetical protein
MMCTLVLDPPPGLQTIGALNIGEWDIDYRVPLAGLPQAGLVGEECRPLERSGPSDLTEQIDWQPSE